MPDKKTPVNNANFSDNVPADLSRPEPSEDDSALQPTPERNCTLCYNAVREQQYDHKGEPLVGQYLYSCRLMPPVPILIPTGPQSANLSAQFPHVNASCVCAQFDDENGDE